MKEKNRFNKTSIIYLTILVLISLITLFLCACTSTGKNETATINNVTDQAAIKDNSDAGKTDGDQEIVCRTRLITGSTFKKTVCVTKTEWAKRDKIKREKMEEFDRDMGAKNNLYDEEMLGGKDGTGGYGGLRPQF